MRDQEPIPDAVTYTLNLQGVLVGGKPAYGGRAMVVWLGVDRDRVVTASQGRLTGAPRGGMQTYARKSFAVDRATVKREGEKVTGQITVPDTTLDMGPCVYAIDFTNASGVDVLLVTTGTAVRP